VKALKKFSAFLAAFKAPTCQAREPRTQNQFTSHSSLDRGRDQPPTATHLNAVLIERIIKMDATPASAIRM
jgi:hypothetical protein